MRRRTLLKLVSGWLGAACAAVVAVPGMGFVLEALRRNRSNGELTRRIARLKDLPIGKPVAVPIVGARQDAWTVHPDEVLGRVWLVRNDAGQKPVAAFTASIRSSNSASRVNGQEWAMSFKGGLSTAGSRGSIIHPEGAPKCSRSQNPSCCLWPWGS